MFACVKNWVARLQNRFLKRRGSERQKPRHFLMQKTRQRIMQFGAQMLTTKLPDISDYASIALISQAIFCCTIKMAHVWKRRSNKEDGRTAAFVKMFSWVYLGFVWKTIRGSSILLVQQSGYWWTSRRCSTFRAAADGTSRWFTRCWSFQRLTSSLIVIFNQFKALPNIITGWSVEAKVMANSHFHRDRRLWKLMECTSNLGT